MITAVILLLVFLFPGLVHAQTVQQTFSLSWTDNSNNEEGFFIYRGGVKVGQVGINVVAFKDTVTGTVGQQVCYQVSAFNHQFVDGTGNLQESAKSNQACGTIPVPTQPVPSAPSGLTVQALSSSQIQSSWSDNSDNEDHFRLVQRGERPPRSTAYSLPANIVTFTAGGLKKDTTYCYKVAAENEGGLSNYSNESCATTRR